MKNDALRTDSSTQWAWGCWGILVIAGLSCLAVSGCGSAEPPRVATFPVAGKVSLDGKPAAGAFVILHPKTAAQGSVPKPTALVKPDGSFELTTYGNGDGAPEGEYTATVTWRRFIERDGEKTRGPEVIPVTYRDAKKSKWNVRVAASENKLAPVEIKKK